MKGYGHKRRAAGRPRIDASVEKIIIDHKRRELVVCRATYNPSSDWVAQQIRDAYPFDEAPKIMLMDHDSIFVPVMNKTLPNMGIKVVRISVGCPKQNGVVERLKRTLTEELLDHVVPLGAQHINRLLKQYQTFYNTARPHRANDGQSPIQQENAANDVSFAPGTLRAEAIWGKTRLRRHWRLRLRYFFLSKRLDGGEI